MQSPEVWSNQNLANELGQKSKEIKDTLEQLSRWETIIDDAQAAQEIGDAELITESETQLLALEKELDKYDIQRMLSCEYDEADAFLTINELVLLIISSALFLTTVSKIFLRTSKVIFLAGRPQVNSLPPI